MPISRGLRAKKEHVIIAATGSIGQIIKQLVCRGRHAGLQVHLEVTLVGHPDHHGPRFGFAQPNAHPQFRARKGGVTCRLDMVPDPYQGVDRVNALHVPKYALVEEAHAGQHRCRLHRAWWAFQTYACVFHAP